MYRSFVTSLVLCCAVGCSALEDADGDGHPVLYDCDDADPSIHFGAEETCNQRDDDCDGRVDEEATDGLTFHRDADGDGYGSASHSVRGCIAPEGYVTDATDCDDGRDTVSPAGAERCNELDDDCDGGVDEDAEDATLWYADADGDGAGDAAASIRACDAPDGHVASGDDCDDGDATSRPGDPERCDGADNDCDGEVDEASALDASTWYGDADGDGYGNPDLFVVACEAPEAFVDNALDCDDTEELAWIGGTERCDGADNDCDGSIDVGAVDADTWYADADGDGYGTPLYTTSSCTVPAGYVADATDCDDTEALAWTGASELCDGVDNDCDGTVDNDDALDATDWYADVDGDGYGDASEVTTACTAPSSTVADATDCDDTDGDVHPGAVERCDGVDTDCDATTSEEGMVSHIDVDGNVTDWTSLFGGSSSGTVDVTVSDAGELAFCEGTFYANLDVTADVAIYAVHGAETTVLDGGGAGSVIAVQGTGLAVALSDLTVQHGEGDSVCIAATPDICGGGLACEGDSSTELEVDGVLFTDNDAHYGAAISAPDCTVLVRDSVLTRGEAGYGGGFWTSGTGSFTLVDSEVSENEAEYGGGFVTYYWSAQPTVRLEGTLVRDNLADYGGGAWVYASVLECDGTSDDAGFLGNTADIYGGGVYFFDRTAEIEATSCDLGEGTEDNEAFDIASYFGDDRFHYVGGDDLDFSCSDARCGSETEYVLGGSTSTEALTTALVGSVFTVSSGATITRFGFYLDDLGDCAADFYLLTASTESASDWEVLWVETDVAVGDVGGVVESADVGASPVVGGVYAIAVATTCTSGGLEVRSDGTSPADDVGIGRVTTSVSGSLAAQAAVGDSIVLTATAGGEVWEGVVTVGVLE